MKRIVFTGGGSAGHVTPNIALFPDSKAWAMIYIILAPTMVSRKN